MSRTGRARAPLPILVAAACLSQPLTAFDQHAPAAPHQAPAAAGRQQTSPSTAKAKPAAKAGAEEGHDKPKDAAKAPASLQDVAKRISTVLAEQSGRPASAEHGMEAVGASPSAGPAPSGSTGAPRPRSRPSPPTVVAPKPALATLKWDPALTSGGVALSWDSQLDPRRVGAADLGIRLVWAPSLSEK